MKTDIDTDWIIPSSHHRLSVAQHTTTTTPDNNGLRSPLPWKIQQFQIAVRRELGLVLKFWNIFRILFWEQKKEKGGQVQWV